MHIHKRAVGLGNGDIRVEKSATPVEARTHQCWRRFMNARAIDRAYVPTSHEHAANCLTHGCLIVPSFIAAQWLIARAETAKQYWSSIIYGSALIFLFSFSTIFHCSCFHPTYRESKIRHILHRVDRAVIYIFMSSSYTPWLLLRTTHSISSTATISIVWIMAFMGITYQLLYHEKYKLLETCCYVVVGLFPAIVIIDMTDHEGIPLMALGGVLFFSGVFFFKADGIIPFAHAIWHGFVFLGAAVHYYAVYNHLIVPASLRTQPSAPNSPVLQ